MTSLPYKSSKNITYGTDKVMKENNIKINIIRNGAFDSSNVEFTVDASILSKIDEQSQAINIKLENTTDFSSAPEIAEYTNENKLSNEFNGIPIKDNKIIEPEKIVRIYRYEVHGRHWDRYSKVLKFGKDKNP